MKITGDTKVKDFDIPEGYQIDTITETMPDGVLTLTIELKKKHEKDWDYYVNGYFKSDFVKTALYANDHYKNCLIKGDYHLVHFEIKIGLLRFICIDIEEDWQNVVIIENQGVPHPTDTYTRLLDICPEAFLKSLFKK